LVNFAYNNQLSANVAQVAAHVKWCCTRNLFDASITYCNLVYNTTALTVHSFFFTGTS